jgi:hypothetical protein
MWLKKWDGFNTKFIPLANIVLAAAIKLLAAIGVGTVQASTSDATMAGVIVAGINWGSFGRFLLGCVINGLISTGAHSGPKNVVEGIKGQA